MESFIKKMAGKINHMKVLDCKFFFEGGFVSGTSADPLTHFDGAF